jgi:hypothetical protein
MLKFTSSDQASDRSYTLTSWASDSDWLSEVRKRRPDSTPISTTRQSQQRVHSLTILSYTPPLVDHSPAVIGWLPAEILLALWRPK